MSKKDYLDSATKKIVQSAAKKMVEDELGVHIDEKQDFFEEIEYDEQAAEIKAVEAMGDASLVTDDFGEIHNDFYNPAADIIYIVIWSGFLVGLYFLLKKYVFGDGGAVSLLLSAFALAVSLLLIYQYFVVKRKRAPLVLMSVYAWGGTGVFLYFLIDELNMRFDGSFSAVWNFITKTELSNYNNYASKQPQLIVFCIICTALAAGLVIALVYQIKYIFRNQNRMDNKIRRGAMRVIRYLAFVFLVFAVFFGIKTYFDIQSLHNAHINAYNTAIQISETCTNQDEVLTYVNNCGLDFETEKDADGNITGCTYNHNYTQLIISFNDTDAESEYEAEMGSVDKEDYLYQLAFESMERDTTKDIYTIELYVNSPNDFELGYDSLTLRPLLIGESDEKALCSFIPADHKIDERYEYYKSINPNKFKFYYTNNKIFNRQYKFTYMRDSGRYKYEDEFITYAGNEAIDDFYEWSEKAVDLVKDNPSIGSKELAQKTAAKIETPEISKEEYMKSVNRLGSFFDASKEALADLYDTQYKYVVNDDWYFYVVGSPIWAIGFVSCDYITLNKYIDESKGYGLSLSGSEYFCKLSSKGGYFDREGYFYQNAEKVPYYNSNGDKFYFYTSTIKTGDTSVGDLKEYYITDRKNVYYDLNMCYIDEDGYLYYDSTNRLEKIDDEHYKSSSGKVYTKLAYTSWNSDGEIILPSDIAKE